MPSHFSWIDFSEEDRQKMMDVVRLFSEREARDELGIGTVRDSFAEFFFPGTSTIQTRAKYFLLIPWIYRTLEEKRVPSARIAAAARRSETRLIYALLASGDTEGVIGQEAKEGLQRLPSAIYWNGLRSWGILRYPGWRDQYHRELDSLYRRRRSALKTDDEEPVDGNLLDTWHPGLPEAPRDFPQTASLELTPTEAQYLQERIMPSHPDSMLARLALWPEPSDCDFPWEHPIVPSLTQALQTVLDHACNFSETIFGAALLYNLLLARALPNEELVSRYESLIGGWVALIESREDELRRWFDEGGLWNCLALRQARIPPKTRSFVDGWLSLILGERAKVVSIASDQAAASLIRMREYMLKGNRARLHNRRALERWRGNAGAFRLDYRWSTVQTILNDIITGLLGGICSAQA